MAGDTVSHERPGQNYENKGRTSGLAGYLRGKNCQNIYFEHFDFVERGDHVLFIDM